MLYLLRRVAVKLQTVNIGETLPHKGLSEPLSTVYTRAQNSSVGCITCLDPVPSSFHEHNAQGINVTNCDVTTTSRVNLAPINVMSHHTSTLVGQGDNFTN